VRCWSTKTSSESCNRRKLLHVYVACGGGDRGRSGGSRRQDKDIHNLQRILEAENLLAPVADSRGKLADPM